jgi:5,10-methylenetetrahydromethanopterin reductase
VSGPVPDAGRVGVIAHLENPSGDDIVALARAAEAAGADWLGIADAFWWRDCWVLLAGAARATQRIALGPMVTNPYLRHPFHTVAALATLQDVAGPRVFLGLAAGGSEVSGAAGISRADAPARIAALAGLVRSVAAGGPLDEASGRRLDVPLDAAPIVVAGRGDRVLRAAGRCADRAVLWAVPASDLDRSVAEVGRGAATGRAAGAIGDGPGVVWAPLVVHQPSDRDRAGVIAAYGVVNASAGLRASWGISPALVDEVRAALVGGGAAAAAHLVPAHVVDDVALPTADPEVAAGHAARIGADEIAVPAFDIATVGERVAWARRVLAARS